MKAPQTVSTAEEDEIFDQPKEYVVETYLALLKGLKVSRNGTIADMDGNVVGKVEEGDPVALGGYEIGDDGEIPDVYGNVIGRAGIAEDREKVEEETRAQEEEGDQEEDEAQEKEVEDLHEEAEWEVELKPSLDIVKGKRLNEQDNIVDDAGAILATLDWVRLKACTGKVSDENGYINDDHGKINGIV